MKKVYIALEMKDGSEIDGFIECAGNDFDKMINSILKPKNFLGFPKKNSWICCEKIDENGERENVQTYVNMKSIVRIDFFKDKENFMVFRNEHPRIDSKSENIKKCGHS